MEKKYNVHIEALRGFAALFVVFFHLITQSTFFNAGYGFRHTFLNLYAPPGHTMVLVFFMMSGYVIGLNYENKNELFSILLYLKKRFVRLYPIYIFSILLTILIFKSELISIIGNLFFLQNVFVNCLPENLPLWSLNHEIVFYLLAIVLLTFKINHKLVFVVFLLLVLSCFVINVPAVIEGYIVGFIFWLSGYIMSSVSKETESEFSANKFISVMLLLLTCEHLNLGGRILALVQLPHPPSKHSLDNVANISNFTVYFYCLYALAVCSSAKIKFLKVLTWFVYLNSFLHLLNLLINGSFFKTMVFYIPSILLIISLFFYFLKPFKMNLKPLVFLGSISYAIYVIHSPIEFSFSKISFFTGNMLSLLTRTGLIIGIVIIISYLLEKKLQPFVKKMFFKQ